MLKNANPNVAKTNLLELKIKVEERQKERLKDSQGSERQRYLPGSVLFENLAASVGQLFVKH